MHPPSTRGFHNSPGLPAPLRRLLTSTLVDTLTTPHGVDRYLEVVNPLWVVHEVRARVVAVMQKTPSSLTLTLQPGRSWQGFAAGQYIRLGVDIDGQRRERCFSPANSVYARNGQIELTLRIHAQGLVTRYLAAQAKPGLIVRLSQAEGRFALPTMRPERIILISGGSGVTPVMAMLRTLLDERHTGAIRFLHYAQSAQEEIYRAEVDALMAQHANLHVQRVYADATSSNALTGYFCKEHLQAVAPDYAQAQTFLCGPAGLMQSVQNLFAAEGLSEQLHLEHFTAASLPNVTLDAASALGEVRFTRSERLTQNNGDTLLNQAEAAGLSPVSGCRMGICHACTCRKTSGRVRDLRSGQISDADESDIQLCVSVPVGTVTLDL